MFSLHLKLFFFGLLRLFLQIKGLIKVDIEKHNVEILCTLKDTNTNLTEEQAVDDHQDVTWLKTAYDNMNDYVTCMAFKT